MRKYNFIAISFFLLLQTVQPMRADNVVSFDTKRLPPEAHSFILRYFPGVEVSHIKIEKDFLRVKKYEVLLTDRTEIEFDGNGFWVEVECDRVPVPSELLPAYLSQYVAEYFPQAFVVKLEKKSKGRIEADLNNDLSLTFSQAGKLIDIDD